MARHSSVRTRRPAYRTLLTALALCAPAAVAVTGPAPAQAGPVDPAVELTAPGNLTVSSYQGIVWSDLNLRLRVTGAPLEIWSQRPTYDEPVVVTQKKGSGDVVLPASTRIGSLDRLLKLTFTSTTDPDAGPKVRRLDGCLNARRRISPEGPFVSPYPYGCYYNPYAVGAVQGIPNGWNGSVVDPSNPGFRMRPGSYEVTVEVAPGFADAIGMTDDQRSETLRLVVEKQRDEDGACRGCRPAASDTDLTPEATQPRGSGVGSLEELPAGTPVPDLRSLPAFGIGLNGKGTQLRFAADVWNGGSSDLVVDGFRREGEAVMDAYQYFIDEHGDVLAYEPVGQMEWDPDPTHQHWHFTDFATYRLLDADGDRAVRSGKEAFCLANTDAIDMTGEGANWQVHYDDLGSVCGGKGAKSIREVLAAGWGDTYAQFRAGQAFPIKNLPDGIYYIEVTANPEGNLLESDTDNNTALRKIKLRTNAAGERRVKAFPVGIVDENDFFGRR